MPPKGIRSITHMDSAPTGSGVSAGPSPSGNPPPPVNPPNQLVPDAVNEQQSAVPPNTTGTKTEAAPSPAPSPSKSQPKYVEETICNLTPHVRLIKRTSLQSAKGQVSMLLVRKTVADTDRARRELEHLYAQCRHPNVLKYISGVKHRDGSVDVDMEYADAGQLDKVLAAVAPQDRIAAAKCCARQVLAGLTYYHEVHGRCHRDVKASNFLLRCDGIVKVSDFDVSRDMKSAGGGGGGSDITVRGTGPYMSPELVLNGFNLDPVKCDVWSIGVTIFQLLEGCLPFEKFRFGSFTAPGDQHVKQLSWHLVQSDSALEYLMRRCLLIKPEDRPNLCEATAVTYIVSPTPAAAVVAKKDDGGGDGGGEMKVVEQAEEGKKAADAEAKEAQPGMLKASTSSSSSGADDCWSGGFAPASDPSVQAALKLKVKLCDEVLLQCRCTANDPDIDEKVKRAGVAIHEELQSWKVVRSNPQTRDAVDKAMKEVVRLRCERSWSMLAQIARLQHGGQ